MDILPLFWRFFISQPWVIPVTGVLVACLAYLMGRRWLVARIASPRPVEEEGPTKLVTAKVGEKAAPERRAAPRRKGKRIEVFVTDDSKEDPVNGWVVDRSIGGLCLVVNQPLEEGMVLNVRPRQAPQTAPWIAVEIRSCRAEGDDWEVGCRFLKTPQWNDLLFFG